MVWCSIPELGTSAIPIFSFAQGYSPKYFSNIGKYKVVKDEYTTINGNKVPIEYYVLEVDTPQAPKVIATRKRDCAI
ncbi:MAG: hypothetical protein ACKO6K_10285, partial [Chitinophagaceae bacterium]